MKTAARPVLISKFMRPLTIVGVLVSSCLMAAGAVAETGLSSEPYTVLVAYEEAHARCGPSPDYYRTDPLRHGQELEVYVETDDGWLGVRPPENSFCWVPASAIETAQRGQLGTVLEDRTVAWIGTHLGRAKRYRWQVQLAEGESVTIIGRSERDGPDGPQLWYRIVPPSGEFRWVHRDQVAMNAEELIALNERNQSIALEREREKLAKERAELSSKLARAKTTAEPTPQKDDSSVAKSKLGRSILEKFTKSEVQELETIDIKPAGSSRRKAERFAEDRLVPVSHDEQPALAAAPLPASSRRNTDVRVAPMPSESTIGSGAVGSGVKEQWRTNPVRQSVQDTIAQTSHAQTAQPQQQPQFAQQQIQQPQIAQADFISRPRLIEIGGTVDSTMPRPQEQANDANWIIGASRGNVGPRFATHITPSGQPPRVARQASFIQAQPSAPLQTNMQGIAPQPRVVSAESIAQIRAETQGASVEKLHLMLSRLMAATGSAEEAQPIADAASMMARTTGDELSVARARLLMDRVAQYQRIALRRDGQSIIRSNAMQNGVVPANATIPIQNVQGISAQPAAISRTKPAVAPASIPAATGYLVQVYSSRSNSPPYALTDNVGNTITYLTPAPGVDLRIHLNNQITVYGNMGYVQGLKTPHVLVSQAMRSDH